ncbi:MAG: MFS transporter [Clostridiaceae bacterium]
MENKNTIKSKLCYGCGDMFAGGAFLVIGLLFLNFLTDIVELSPLLAGSIFLVGKIWDAVSDPLMGVLSDRTRSKYGRRRVYFLAGILPIFVSFSMLWVSLNTNSQITLFVYYLFTYIFFNTVFTMVMIPYNSLLPDMTKDYKERTSYTTVRLMFSSVSALLSGVLPMIIIKSFGTNVTLGYTAMGLIFAIFYAIPWIFVFSGTFENECTIPKDKFSMSYTINEFKLTFKNKSFRAHAGFFISAQTAVDFLTTLFIYYLTYCLDIKNKFSLVLGILLIVQLLSMPIHMKISKKFGKTAPLRVGLSIWIIALIISLTISSTSNTNLVFLVAVLSGIGTSASTFVPWSILPELSDVDELMTGRRREGIYSGMSTLLRKIAQAISVFIIGVILDTIGYIPNVVQKSSTIIGIKLIFALAPIFFIAISLYFSTQYKMTEEKYEILRNEVARRKNNQGASTDDNTIKICEELTGVSYDKLWTNN